MAKLYQYSRNKCCYYCGANPPSSKEHVPPKMLFKDTKFSAITVPSCDKHNMKKHGFDQGFVTALQLCKKQVIEHEIGDNAMPGEIESIQNVEEGQLKRVGNFQNMLTNAPKRLDFSLPYINSNVDIENWIQQISAGLIWSKIGQFKPEIKWNLSRVWSPHFIQSDGPISFSDFKMQAIELKEICKDIESIDWQSGWYREPHGYPEKIYNFSVFSVNVNINEENNLYIMKHEFYKSLIWFTITLIPQNIIEEYNLYAGDLNG